MKFMMHLVLLAVWVTVFNCIFSPLKLNHLRGIGGGNMINNQTFKDIEEAFEQAKNLQELNTVQSSFLKKKFGIDSTFYGFVLNPNIAFLSEKQRVIINLKTKGSNRQDDTSNVGSVLENIVYQTNHPKAWVDAIKANPFLFECSAYYELLQSKKHIWYDSPQINLLSNGKARENEIELIDKLDGCSMDSGVSLLNSPPTKGGVPSCVGARSSLVRASEFKKIWLENEHLICAVFQRFDEIVREKYIVDFFGLTKKEIEVLDHANIPQKGIQFIIGREEITVERRVKTIKEKLCSRSLYAAGIMAAKLGI